MTYPFRPTEGQAADVQGPRQPLATFTDYADAQRLVDRLSDGGFPVEHVSIVGSDLRLVEAVTGRLTKGRAAAGGAMAGAWFGLLLGLIVGLFTSDPTWLGLILGGLLVGALWGAAFGYLAHAATGGQRDFSSLQSLVAGRYDVLVSAEHLESARQLMGTV